MPFSSPQAALRFYGEEINKHRFDLLLSVLSDDVVFWFSSGSHHGLDAARQAFERTWTRLGNEFYWLEDVCWISEGVDSATCIYRFNRRGTVEGEPARGEGRGTSVFRKEQGGWKLVHEHLSAEPAHAG